MSERDINYAVDVISGAGHERVFQRICDAGDVGVKMPRDAAVALFIALRVARYVRGKAIATPFGYSVSTRLIVRKSQASIRARGPGWWRS